MLLQLIPAIRVYVWGWLQPRDVQALRSAHACFHATALLYESHAFCGMSQLCVDNHQQHSQAILKRLIYSAVPSPRPLARHIPTVEMLWCRHRLAHIPGKIFELLCSARGLRSLSVPVPVRTSPVLDMLVARTLPHVELLCLRRESPVIFVPDRQANAGARIDFERQLVTRMSQVLSACPRVRFLQLQRGLTQLLPALGQLTPDLRGLAVRCEGQRKLQWSAILQQLPALESLLIQDQWLVGVDGQLRVCHRSSWLSALVTNARLPALRHLCLQTSASAWTRVLATHLPQLHTLTLALDPCVMRHIRATFAMSRATHQLRVLTLLVLVAEQNTSACVLDLANACPHLRSLTLDGSCMPKSMQDLRCSNQHLTIKLRELWLLGDWPCMLHRNGPLLPTVRLLGVEEPLTTNTECVAQGVRTAVANVQLHHPQITHVAVVFNFSQTAIWRHLRAVMLCGNRPGEACLLNHRTPPCFREHWRCSCLCMAHTPSPTTTPNRSSHVSTATSVFRRASAARFARIERIAHQVSPTAYFRRDTSIEDRVLASHEWPLPFRPFTQEVWSEPEWW